MTEYKTLPEAIAAIQDAIKQPEKTENNPMFKSGYVSLEGVTKAIVEAKREVGAKVFIGNEEGDDGHMYTVFKGYGETLKMRGSELAQGLANRGTNEAQAHGSATTYARRYSLSMALMIVSEIDDDGNAANGQRQKKASVKPAPKPRYNRNDLLTRMDEAISAYKAKTGAGDLETYGVIGNFAGIEITDKTGLNQLDNEKIIAVGKHLAEITKG